MSFNYKNPQSAENLDGNLSVLRNKTFGTHFSVLGTGGYMEVWSLSDLNFYTGATAQGSTVELSANTIPIEYYASNLFFIPNSMTLQSDGISSGRRRLGMLVYVHETDKVYQYHIPNYESLYNAASGSTTDLGDAGIRIEDNTAGGKDFIDAWLDSSIEGFSGATAQTARWRIFWGTDWQVTGGTVDYNSTGDLNLNSNSGNTVTISGLKTITGGTYFSGTSTLELYNNLGDTIDITGFSSGDGFTLSGNTTDGLISYGTPSVGIVENNLTFNGDNNTLTLSGDSVTNGVEYQQTESTTTVTNGNHNIYTIPLTSGCTFEYTYFVEENNTGVFRSGKILTSLNNSKTNVVYNDYSTEDGIGSTEDIEFESLISGSNLVLRAVTTNNTQWTIKIKLNVLF